MTTPDPAAFVAAWLDAHGMPSHSLSPFEYRAAMVETLTALLDAYTAPLARQAQYWAYLRQHVYSGATDLRTGFSKRWYICSPLLGESLAEYATVEEAMEAQLRLEEEAGRATQGF